VIAVFDISEFTDESGVLLTKTVLDAGITKPVLYKAIRDNEYEQVGQGVYITYDAWADDSYVLSMRCPVAVFSHDEALYYYGYIDREPIQQTITVYTGYGTGRLTADGIRVYTVKKELLDVGKTEVINSFGHSIPIYDRERTICDLIRSRSNFEIQDFQTALKSYVSDKNKNLNKLMEYARLFRVDRKIREYMEVLL